MSPSESQAIVAKVDSLFGKLTHLTNSVTALTEQVKAHTEADERAREIRALTCPTAPDLRQAQIDIAAIAGIQRADHEALGKHDSRLTKLERWRTECEKDEEVEEAKHGIMYAPLKWAWTHMDRILGALAITYMLYRFGF